MAVIQRQQQIRLPPPPPVDHPRAACCGSTRGDNAGSVLSRGRGAAAAPATVLLLLFVVAAAALAVFFFFVGGLRTIGPFSQQHQKQWGTVMVKTAHGAAPLVPSDVVGGEDDDVPLFNYSKVTAPTTTAMIEDDDDDDFTIAPRIFAEWPADVAFPCYPPRPGDELLRRAWQDRAAATQGLLYEKPNKCASTTLAGVNMRIARNAARRLPHVHHHPTNLSMCDLRWSHGRAYKGQRYRYRNKSTSFLWSAIREPTSRAVSWYFFKHVSLDGHTSSNHTDLREFQEFWAKQTDHFYLSFLDTRPYEIRNWTDAVAEINFVLKEYDFVGVTERLDESLVVLMLLLRLPMADVLYYSSKVHSGLFARGPGTPCIYLQPSTVTKEMESFFASDVWNDKVRSDRALYRAVHRSLDLTMDALGRNRVEAQLARFRHAQARVRERCQGKVQMPCDREGDTALPVEETGCLVGDVGCGMDCLDGVATELGLWTASNE
jgi:Galactose-3-O-sulfotransferase